MYLGCLKIILAWSTISLDNSSHLYEYYVHGGGYDIHGELKTVRAGWVMSHVIDDDECNNARYGYGKNWKEQIVDQWTINMLTEKAAHFGEALSLPVYCSCGSDLRSIPFVELQNHDNHEVK